MSATKFRYVIPVVALALAPIGLAAQEPGAAAPAQMPAEARQVIEEMQQIQAQLGPIQEKALEDAALRSEGEALGARIEAAMAAVDPSTPERMRRLEALMEEAAAAQAEKNEARFGELVTEAREIERALQAAQAAAIQRPEVAVEVNAFESHLVSRMNEVDPEAEQLLARLEELNERLAAILGVGS